MQEATVYLSKILNKLSYKTFLQKWILQVTWKGQLCAQKYKQNSAISLFILQQWGKIIQEIIV